MGQSVAWHYHDFGFNGLIKWRRIRQLGHWHIGGEILGNDFYVKLGGVIRWWHDNRHPRINPVYRLGLPQLELRCIVFAGILQEPVPAELLLPRIIPFG